MKNVSLKLKLFALLVFLTTFVLTCFAWIALSEFRKDKRAYVLDTNMNHARTVATQVRSDIESAMQKLQFYMRGYNYETGFHPYSKTNMYSDSDFDEIRSYQMNETGTFVAKSQLQKKWLAKNETKKIFDKNENEVLTSNIQSAVQFLILNDDPGKWMLRAQFTDVGTQKPVMVIAIVTKGAFLNSFLEEQVQDTYLLNESNMVVAQPFNVNFSILPTHLYQLAQETVAKLNSSTVIQEIKIGKTPWLVGASKVGINGFKVMAVVPKSKAFEAIQTLALKSGVLAGFLICITIAMSVIFSNSLTSALKKLVAATTKVSQGDFSISVDVKSGDEIGVLAGSFNHMTKEIRKLLDETADKARMESELQTARTVQSSLFPSSDYVSDFVEIRGFYEPAGECSGDWWYYTKVGSKYYFWIGDATGHGVPAALVTSAAKSAREVIQMFPELSVQEVISLFNRAIHGTSHGQVMMTFFMGAFDEVSGEFIYSNASHDPPFLLSKTGKLLKKDDIQPLLGAKGARLGEAIESRYTEARLKLNPGDRVVFYTDGVTELNNIRGKMLGERRFVQNLIDAANDGKNLEATMNSLQDEIAQFRDGCSLNDDCTYFMFEYKKTG